MSTLRVLAVMALFCQYLAAQASPHGPLKQACTDCHTTNSWKELAVPMKFNHAVTGFLLQGAHASVQCIQCHTTKRFAGTASDCFTCHTKDYAKAMSPNHQKGLIAHDCLSCHTQNSFRPSVFDHAKTNFALVGAHGSVECASCHVADRYKGLPSDCFSCHQKDFSTTTSPNHTAASFSRECLTCHTMTSWKPSTFDHNRTNFALVGVHRSVECYQCHTGGKFKGLATDCYSCHQKDFAKTVKPNHVAAQMDHQCATCHTVITWTPSTFDHAKTEFQLVGAHTAVECSKCHTGGPFKGTSKECYPCHKADIDKLVTPDHNKGQFSHDCLTCHTTTIWKPSIFDHNKTNFALTGAHIKTDCAKCHKNEVYKNLASDCYTCHLKEYTGVVTPNHVAGQFDHDCASCHTTTIWKPSTFDHAKTNFPLKGAHVSVDCASCHTNGKFKGTASDCYSCHVSDFTGVVSPNHVTGQYSHDCLSCHSINAWKPATFNHSTTAFPLTGAHAAVTCESCHKNGVFKGTATDCYSCHQSNFTSVLSPNHVSGQFSHDCLTCHTTSVWKPSTFNHSTTAFPLTGAHSAVECASCHTNGVFKGTATDCYSCHQTDFAGVTTPSHVANQFSHDCLTCHSTSAWKPSTFNHSTTAFPLTGAHSAVACASCHTNGVYKGTATDCYSCHQTDFAGVTSPSHVTNQFSHDCLTCHSTTAWKPSTFNHSTTAFPLTGAHSAVACASCHTNGVYKGTATDCYSCHQSKFTGVTSPNHVTGQFSHDCLTCHTTSVWKPSTFNHASTAFPLLGAHAAVSCGDCHKNGVFKGTASDCYSCHQADYTGVTDPNHVTKAYDHNCLTCHNMNGWTPVTFNHSITAFPLTGTHTSTPCASCHVGNKYTGTTTSCYTCHLTDYTNVKSPNHVTGNYNAAKACTVCHNTTVWKPWILNHNTYYNISKHHGSSVTCDKCHKTAGNLSTASCTTGCHTGAHHQTQTCYVGSNCHAGSSH